MDMRIAQEHMARQILKEEFQKLPLTRSGNRRYIASGQREEMAAKWTNSLFFDNIGIGIFDLFPVLEAFHWGLTYHSKNTQSVLYLANPENSRAYSYAFKHIIGISDSSFTNLYFLQKTAYEILLHSCLESFQWNYWSGRAFFPTDEDICVSRFVKIYQAFADLLRKNFVTIEQFKKDDGLYDQQKIQLKVREITALLVC
ncbi:MAG: hypothetical protein G01um101470_648 [Parcubacteria group bacterium Gr01-1014_70]|nr:MAG: hypothetical protein G01um101470_648 [Parcubacteria group bacterium Gr01-1014_70]